MWKEMAMKMNILRINYWKWVFHFNRANFFLEKRKRKINCNGGEGGEEERNWESH